MAEASVTATSTPSRSSRTESTYQERKRRRAERYLAGVSRASHRLEGSLEASLSSPEISLLGPEDSDEEVSEAVARKRTKREQTCQRGCAVALKRLAVTYHHVGTHTGKTAQYRKSSYPNPKKGAAPRSTSKRLRQDQKNIL